MGFQGKKHAGALYKTGLNLDSSGYHSVLDLSDGSWLLKSEF
jgi:hypothetical protein